LRIFFHNNISFVFSGDRCGNRLWDTVMKKMISSSYQIWNWQEKAEESSWLRMTAVAFSA